MIELELPYPPSINHYYVRKIRRVVLTRTGKRYRERVAECVLCAGRPTISGKVTISIDLYPPDNRKRDVDNTQKALLDALQHSGVFADDSQVRTMHVAMHEACPPMGKAFVTIRPNDVFFVTY